MNIKKGDTVFILKGKDRGKSGKIASVNPEENRVVVQGLNMAKRSVRPKKAGDKGQIVSIAQSLNASNVMLLCPSCGKRSKVGYRMEGETKKRYCKKCSNAI